MQQPYRKGVAIHLGPESCAVGREARGEALTGGHAGHPSSSEITTSACRPSPDRGKAIPRTALGEPSTDAAESETLCMRGSSMRENRETSGIPTSSGRGTVGEGHQPHARRARSRGVGRSRSTDEAGEPSRPAGGSGVRGGKGIDQGEFLIRWPRAGHSAGYRGSFWRAGIRAAPSTGRSRSTRGKSRMR